MDWKDRWTGNLCTTNDDNEDDDDGHDNEDGMCDMDYEERRLKIVIVEMEIKWVWFNHKLILGSFFPVLV
jgi:hypothetical protein